MKENCPYSWQNVSLTLLFPHTPPVAHTAVVPGNVVLTAPPGTNAMVTAVGVIAGVHDQVDKTHALVGLAVPPPRLGDDEPPRQVHAQHLGRGPAPTAGRQLRRDDEVVVPAAGSEAGVAPAAGTARGEEVRHRDGLLPAALAEVISDAGLWTRHICQLSTEVRRLPTSPTQ